MPQFEPTSVTSVRLEDLPAGTQQSSEIPSGEDAWHRFAIGYKDAADCLASRISKDPWRYSLMAAPMLFLFRHYVELHLKSLLLDAGELLDEPQAVPHQHYLRSLWSRVRALLLRISPESDGAWFVRADRIIEDFDSIDEGSFACRYPVRRNGEPSLPDAFKVDADVARQMIAELSILLDGASAQIDVYMGYKYDAY